LAPGETYYGHGNFGPHSVNITNINITNIQVQKIVYKNVHIHNAVTVIHRDTFVTGRKVEVRVRENPFLKEKISIGRPDIKPEKTTVMPVVKEIPQAKRPPEPIREIKVKELKGKRPFVKEKEAPVLRPGSQPKELRLKVKEGKPVERDFEKFEGRKPASKGVEKPKEVRPSGKTVQKPEPIERGDQKTKEMKPPERATPGKVKEVKPSEKEGPARPKEFRPSERGADKSRELRPPEKSVGKIEPVEKREGKTKEIKPTQRVTPGKAEVVKPSGKEELGQPKEFRPSERGIDKSKEPRPFEKAGETQGPAGRGMEKSDRHK
jgi:hypothetical protein